MLAGELSANAAAIEAGEPGPKEQVKREIVRKTEPIAPHGGDRTKGQGRITTFKDRGAQYLTARLKRDAPDIAAQLERGEFKSVRQAAIAANIIKPIAPHGTNQHSEGGCSDRTSSKRGETAEYLTARLKRDAPDIAAQLERGEFKSVRQAAIAANIIKPPTPHGGDRTKEQGSVRTLARGENAQYLTARLKRDAPDIAAQLERGEFKSVRQAAIAANIIKPPTPHGGDRTKGQGANGTFTKRGQNNAQYLTARLKRDAPEIAAQLERGEFKSVRQAAIAANIIKPPTPVSRPFTPAAPAAPERLDCD